MATSAIIIFVRVINVIILHIRNNSSVYNLLQFELQIRYTITISENVFKAVTEIENSNLVQVCLNMENVNFLPLSQVRGNRQCKERNLLIKYVRLFRRISTRV